MKKAGQAAFDFLLLSFFSLACVELIKLNGESISIITEGILIIIIVTTVMFKNIPE